MGKTLHKNTKNTNTKKTVEIVDKGTSSEELIDLAQDMKGAWQDAANDLLQPRPEAVAQLLKKVLH